MARIRRARGLDPFDQSFDATFRGKLVSGRALYDEVIAGGLARAKESVWIATANVKELFVERPGLGRRRVASVVGCSPICTPAASSCACSTPSCRRAASAPPSIATRRSSPAASR